MNGVIDLRLRFAHVATGFTLRLYVGASHGREAHHTAAGFCKSRSGGCIFASGACIYAWSSIQQSTALSTFESELYALALGTRHLLALRCIASFIIGATLPTSLVFCDNQSVIAQLLRRDLSSRSRHIRTNLGFVYEAIDNGDIRVEYIHSEANPANTHTLPPRTATASRKTPPSSPDAPNSPESKPHTNNSWHPRATNS